jgi:hypothetical protein
VLGGATVEGRESGAAVKGRKKEKEKFRGAASGGLHDGATPPPAMEAASMPPPCWEELPSGGGRWAPAAATTAEQGSGRWCSTTSACLHRGVGLRPSGREGVACVREGGEQRNGRLRKKTDIKEKRNEPFLCNE